MDIKKSCSASSDNDHFWANKASTPVIMLTIFVLVNFFALSESQKIALVRCVLQSLE